MTAKPRIELITDDAPRTVEDFAYIEGQELTLRALLARFPLRATSDLTPHLDRPLHSLTLVVRAAAPFDYRHLAMSTPTSGPAEPRPDIAPQPALLASPGAPSTLPEQLSERQAVLIAHGEDIERTASFLAAGLSALVYCDTLLVDHLIDRIAHTAALEARVLKLPDDPPNPLAPTSQRQRQLVRLRELLHGLKDGQVLVLPHLDLLGAGGERSLSSEGRELTELLYERSDRLLLAFADRTLPLPEVLAARFAVRLVLAGVPQKVGPREAPLQIGEALVTREEAALFRGFSPADLYKNVAGLNPVRLRHALTYAVKRARDRGHGPDNLARASDLHDAIRAFKVQMSEAFAIPDVKMEDIGGYQETKDALQQAIDLITGAWQLPDERLRRELIPRGFLLYGPPGTGKTLFAKAVATRLQATIRIISGPEVTDMYVGESERKVREIFADARRNAPSVIVFDEFDSIAAKRSGRDDGGSRAGNALVAQILTEMDGFRPDVPMLVIGTTNRIELIDEALLRPSRFQAIAVDLPDEQARTQIAKIHAAHFQVAVTAEVLRLIAQNTYGCNGDQIRSIFRDACLEAARTRTTPTSERLGWFVGRIRSAAERQKLDRLSAAYQRIAGDRPRPDARGAGDRPGPSLPMMPMPANPTIRPQNPGGTP